MDNIDSLPVDKNPVKDDELQLVNTIFTENSSTVETLFSQSKDFILLGCLFVLINLEYVDEFLKKFFSNFSDLSRLGIKTLIFLLSYFILKYGYLLRK